MFRLIGERSGQIGGSDSPHDFVQDEDAHRVDGRNVAAGSSEREPLKGSSDIRWNIVVDRIGWRIGNAFQMIGALIVAEHDAQVVHGKDTTTEGTDMIIVDGLLDIGASNSELISEMQEESDLELCAWISVFDGDSFEPEKGAIEILLDKGISAFWAFEIDLCDAQLGLFVTLFRRVEERRKGHFSIDLCHCIGLQIGGD